MTIDLTFTRDRRFARRIAWLRARRSLLVLVIFGLLLIGLSWLLLTSPDERVTMPGAVAGIVGVTLIFLVTVAIPRVLRRVPEPYFDTYRLLVDDTGVRITGPRVDTWMSWQAVGPVRALPYVLLVSLRGGRPWMDLPRVGLAAEQDAALVAAFRDRGLMTG